MHPFVLFGYECWKPIGYREGIMAKNDPPDDVGLPQPMYQCTDADCAEDRCWPSTFLHWVPEWDGWFCDLCIDNGPDELQVGPSLQEWLLREF